MTEGKRLTEHGAHYQPQLGGQVASVEGLWRIPVKSTAGEQATRVVVGHRGVLHDREWAAYTTDGGIASGKTTRRFRHVAGMLQWRSSATNDASSVPRLHSPNGTAYRVDDRAASEELSRSVGQQLMLRRETTVQHHDDSPLHLVTTSSIRAIERLVGGRVDPERLRANLLLNTSGTYFAEDDWVGADLAVGPDAVIRLGLPMPRCVMVDQRQAHTSAQPHILKTLGQHHGVVLGLQATVVHPGIITVGDSAVLIPRAHS